MMVRWVHISYAHDLMELGEEPTAWEGPFAAFDLGVGDWRAFTSLYDVNGKPTLYPTVPPPGKPFKRS